MSSFEQIPLARPVIGREEEELVLEVLRSGRLSLVREEQTPRSVLGGQPLPGSASSNGADEEVAVAADEDDLAAEGEGLEEDGEAGIA